MTDERGTTLIELLVTSFLSGLILLGLGSLYFVTTKTYGASVSQTSLQRQGTLALQEIGQRIRSGVGPAAVTTVTCNGQANSVSVNTADGTFCFYAGVSGTGDAGKLCEYLVNAPGGCRNLLYGAIQPGATPLALSVQSATPDPTCPQDIAAGAACFKASVVPDTSDASTAEFKFSITDGLNVMAFGATFSCKGRDPNC